MTPLTATAANPALAAEPRPGSVPDASALSFLASLFAVSAGQAVAPIAPVVAQEQVGSASAVARSAPGPLLVGLPSTSTPAALSPASLAEADGSQPGGPRPAVPPFPGPLKVPSVLPGAGDEGQGGLGEAAQAVAALFQGAAREPTVGIGSTEPEIPPLKAQAKGGATANAPAIGQSRSDAATTTVVATPASATTSAAIAAARSEPTTLARVLAADEQSPTIEADAALGPVAFPDMAPPPREAGLPVPPSPTPAAMPVADGGAAASRATVPLLAAELVRAVDQGRDMLTVELAPVELGRVEVALTLDDDGRLRADFGVERPETLRLLQQDSRSLEQLLGSGGLQLADAGLSFNLRQDRGQERDDMPAQPAPRGLADGGGTPEAVASRPARRPHADRLLDLTV